MPLTGTIGTPVCGAVNVTQFIEAYESLSCCTRTDLHQQNVNRSGINMQTSLTLRSTSAVLLSPSRCSEAPLELSKVFSDSARAFSGASKRTCSDGGAFRMLQELTCRIVKFWSSWDLCAAQHSSAGDLVPYYHSSGSYGSITTSHFVYHIRLLQSQDLLHHNMACIIYLSLSIYVHTANLGCRPVLECNRRSTWRFPFREPRDALGGSDRVNLEMYLEAVIELV